nr:MAG TPA: hypothetical protein [Caudoviricetes sp.]
MINTLQNSLARARELIDGMTEQIKMYDGIIDSMIANHGFNHRLRDVLAKMSKEAIDALDANKVDKIIAFTQSKLNEINAAKDEDTDEKKAMTFSEYCISVFKEIYDCCVNYEDAIKEKDNLEKEIRDITNKSYDASTSGKARLEKVESLQKQLDEETDPAKKIQIQKMLDTVRKTEDLSFLTDRIVKLGDNEVRNIINTFFNAKRSSLIMEKFRIRIKRLGYDENTYKMFFNIEEMFLPEEYYPMNNMFLFVAMRFISYADTNNKNDALFCSSLLIKMYNLVYHRFSTPEEEKEFINQIKAVDDYFVPHIATLEEKNVTSPNHPARQEARAENEAKLRESLCNAIHDHGKELTDEVVKMSVKELKEYLEKIVTEEKAEKEAEVESFVSEIQPTVSVDIGDGDSVEIPKADKPEEQVYPNEDLDEEAQEAVSYTTPIKNNTFIIDDFRHKVDNDIMTGTLAPEEEADVKEMINEVEPVPELASALKDVPDKTISDYLNAQYVDEKEYQRNKAEAERRAYDSMVIERRGDVNVPVSFDMTNQYAYVDNYGDIYIPTIDGKAYDFYDSRDGHRVEQNVDEIAVLQLCSSGAVTKKTFSKGILNPKRDTLSNFKFRA